VIPRSMIVESSTNTEPSALGKVIGNDVMAGLSKLLKLIQDRPHHAALYVRKAEVPSRVAIR
jgi:hypothetical protein